jgi:hypothetical protein
MIITDAGQRALADKRPVGRHRCPTRMFARSIGSIG